MATRNRLITRAMEQYLDHINKVVLEPEKAREAFERLIKNTGRFFFSIDVPAVIVDRSGWIARANRSGAHLLGLTSTGAQDNNVNLYSLLAVNCADQLHEVLDSEAETETNFIRFVRLQDDSSNRSFDLKVMPFRDVLGDLLALVLLIDTTATQRVQQLKEIYDALLSSSSEAVYVASHDGMILMANDMASQVYADGKSSLEGRARADVMAPVIAIHHGLQDSNVLQTENHVRSTEQVLMNDGLVKTLSTIKFPVYDSAGDVMAVATIARDVTEEIFVQQRHELGDKVFRFSDEAMLLLDAQMMILDANPSFEHQIDMPAHEVKGASFGDLLSKRQGPSVIRFARESAIKFGQWVGQLELAFAERAPIQVDAKLSLLNEGDQRTSGFVLMLADRSGTAGLQQKIDAMAKLDALTGLPNRSTGEDRLAVLLAQAQRQRTPLSVLFIGLDDFTSVNQVYGYEGGDTILRIMAQRLYSSLRSSDLVYRVIGDTFGVALPGATLEDSVRVGSKLLARIREPLALDGQQVSVSATAGMSSYPLLGSKVDALLLGADAALRLGNSTARGAVTINPQAPEFSAGVPTLVTEVNRALAEHQFEIHWQPIFRLSDQAMTSAEALIRWKHPIQGTLLPGNFFKSLSGMTVLDDLDAWSLDAALKQVALWLKADKLDDDFRICLNRFSRSILKPRWTERLNEACEKHGVPLSRVRIEVPEGLLVLCTPEVIDSMRKACDAGLQIACDDVGSGSTNLSYLHQLPLTAIKIDTEHVLNLDKTDSARVLCKSLVAMANVLGYRVVAEGVETNAQLDFLKSIGCHEAQGFLLGQPREIL